MDLDESIPLYPYLEGVDVVLQGLIVHGALTLDFGAYFGLEGSSQTVPRSERFAIIVLCLLVAPHSHISVGSDSAICVAGIVM